MVSGDFYCCADPELVRLRADAAAACAALAAADPHDAAGRERIQARLFGKVGHTCMYVARRRLAASWGGAPLVGRGRGVAGHVDGGGERAGVCRAWVHSHFVQLLTVPRGPASSPLGRCGRSQRALWACCWSCSFCGLSCVGWLACVALLVHSVTPPLRVDYGRNVFIGDNFYCNFDCVRADLPGPRCLLAHALCPTLALALVGVAV